MMDKKHKPEMKKMSPKSMGSGMRKKMEQMMKGMSRPMKKMKMM